MLGAINVGTWGFFAGAIAPWFPAINVDTTVSEGFRNQIIFVAAITGVQALINHFGIELTAKLTDFSGYLIFAATIVLTISCFVFAEHWDFTRLWTFDNFSGDPTLNAANELKGDPIWPNKVSGWMVFLLGLLVPIYTITGYDASAHTSEETHKAAMSAPRGMVSSVLWSSIFGYVMLIGFLFLIPDMKDAAKQGWNVFFWAIDARFPVWLKDALYVAIFVSQFLCGLATVTSASRMIFAFARDDGLPGSSALKKVSPAHRTPTAAIWTAAILCRSVRLGRFAGDHRRRFGLFDRRLLHGHLPVLLVRGSDRAGARWPTARPGPRWARGISASHCSSLSRFCRSCRRCSSSSSASSRRTAGRFGSPSGFIVLAAIIWVAFEQRRFKGPPIGDMIAKRQAAIAAAEKAVGQV